MSFPNLSSRTSKLMYPSFQDDFDQAHWDSHPQDDDANYEQLYKRVPGQSSSNKMFSQEKRGLSYIDKSIALCTPSDPASLNNKLQKFFKTLTKNYKPVTPRSTNKSPRGTHLTNRQEEGYSPSKNTHNKGSPLVMRKLNSRSQKSFSQGIIENERPLSTNEDDEELIMARENMYGNLVPQQEDRYNEVRDYRQYGNSIPMNSSNMRSLSNPARQSQEEKIMMELGGRNMPRMSNVSTQDQSMLPCFNQSPIVVEDNCNYAYLKSYQNDSEGPHPYQRFLVPEEDPNVDLRGHNPVYIPRKNGPKETVSQSQSSSLKKLDTNQHQLSANHSKKASRTSDLRKKEVYSSQGSPLINYHFSERDDEFEPYRPSIAMPGVAGVYSSMLSDSKDENPNYTDVKLIGGMQAMSHNEIRNEQMLSFAKKSATNFGNTLQQSSEDNKLRTMSQVTDLIDSTEDMFIKQKGCFNMFLALNKIVFKRINSVFQDIKRGPLQFQEVSHGNFVSFGEAIKYESNGLNRVLARHQNENGQGLNMILQGFAKISGMVKSIEIASSRTKQSAFEKIANYGTISQVVYKDRFITGFLLLFAIEKSQRRAALSQSFNTWATTFKMDKLREAETFKYQQIIQILSQEKQKLQEELDIAKEKKAAATASPVVKANPSQKDLKFFLQSMEAPGGPLKLRKDSNDSKPSSTNTTTTTRQEEVPVRASWGEPLPLASRIQVTNKVSEDMDPIKMFNGAIKKAFEQDSTKKMRSKQMFGHEFASSAQKNVQENPNNRYVDTRRNEPENCFSPPQNYIDTLKKQSKGNYESILSPSSQQNYYESRGIEHESNKGSRGDINMKNHLGKGLVGFGVSPPKELTEEDEFTAESIRKGGMGQLGQREFFESLERFDHANVEDTYSNDVYHEQKSSMTMDLSEIMRERTGDMKSIRDIARGMIPRNFDESMMGSEGEQSFYKQGMENVMILKREGI